LKLRYENYIIFSDTILSFTNPRIPNENTSKTRSNFLLICYSIFATLAALILTGISAYRMIIINNMTTTTMTTTTTITLPAQCFSYTTNSDATRAVRYASGSQNDNWMNTTTIWIRFTGAAGTEIVNWSPGGYNCDTTLTGWYVSPMPSYGSTIDGIVCYAHTSTICNTFNTIYVTNCGSFYVFGLVRPPSSSARYCTT